MSTTPDNLILQSCSELCLHHMIEPLLDKRVILLPATTDCPRRPVGIPQSACQLVETRIRYLIDVLRHVRMGTTVSKMSQMDFLREVSNMVFLLMDQKIRLEIEQVAQSKNMTPLPFYVALAIYTKYVAAHTTPLLIERDGLDIVFLGHGM